MKIKTQDLTGAALDWAVAKACMDETVNVYFTEDGHKRHRNDMDFPEFSPSTDWAQGGPIIEREGIKTAPTVTRSAWMAQIRHTKNHPLVAHPVLAGWTNANGPTPLIAAMRCYVASHLGDEVDIPAELSN
jgi:hypothetical protein